MAERKHRKVETSVAAPSATTVLVRVGFTTSARAAWEALPEKVKDGLKKKIRAYAGNPALGKPLTGELRGCHRISYGRIRCVVRTNDGIAVVIVVAVAPRAQGSRKDPYAVAVEAFTNGMDQIEELLAEHTRSYIVEVEQAIKDKKAGR